MQMAMNVSGKADALLLAVKNDAFPKEEGIRF